MCGVRRSSHTRRLGARRGLPRALYSRSGATRGRTPAAHAHDFTGLRVTDGGFDGFRDDVDPIAELDQRRARVIESINQSKLFLVAFREPDGTVEIEMVGAVNDAEEIETMCLELLNAIPDILEAAGGDASG